MADVIGNSIPQAIQIFGRAPNGTLQAVNTDGSGNISITGGTASSVAFSGITSGTNTTAAMIVGTGASLASVPQFNVGAVGTSAVMGFVGSTSGTATITGPATAGTSTNAFNFSNIIQGPDGNVTSPTHGFNGVAGWGMYRIATDGLIFTVASTATLGIRGGGNGTFINNAAGYGWVSGGVVGSLGTIDTAVGRGGAGIVTADTTTPGNALGTFKAAQYNSGASTGVSAGSFSTITAITTVGGIVTQLTGSSDARLKDSKPYDGGLDEIEAITPAIYTWNEKGQAHTGIRGDQEFVGFIAQDVQAAIPEAITATEKSKDGTEEYLSLDDRPIIAALVNAVKELSARVKELEAKQ